MGERTELGKGQNSSEEMELERLQQLRDSIEPADSPIPVTIVPHGSLKKSGSSKSSKPQRSAQDMIDFSAKHIKDPETSIAQHMVEDNKYLVVHQKPAFVK